jgi:hypothetical protein
MSDVIQVAVAVGLAAIEVSQPAKMPLAVRS